MDHGSKREDTECNRDEVSKEYIKLHMDCEKMSR